MDKVFDRGDIVDFVWEDGAKTRKEQNKRNALRALSPFKLIILRPINDNEYLVVACKADSNKTQMKAETNKGLLYIKVLTFYPIDASCLHSLHQTRFLENKMQIVEQIYASHNELLAQKKQAHQERLSAKRVAAARKRQIKKQKKTEEKIAQANLEKQYIGPYELAVMNNDIQRMREIENIVGYAPGRKGPSKAYSKRNGKVLYSNFNPRPCSGGRFTPK